jgi:predicted ABC-type ATPase
MEEASPPWLWLIAGPNGAGKTTLAKRVLVEDMGVEQFVNADEIARGLSPLRPDSVAVAAGRIMLARIEEMVVSRTDFAIETTLASRGHLRLTERLKAKGWSIGLVYVWLQSPDLCLERVRNRVAAGGHDVPEDLVRRRYARGLENLKDYRHWADKFIIFDNSGNSPVLVAFGDASEARALVPETAKCLIPR